MSEEPAWKSRREQVRAKFIQMLADPTTEDDPLMKPVPPGNAPWKAVTGAVSSVMAGARQLLSSDTSAMATDLSGMPLEPPASTTPVESTSSSSASTTVWTVSPVGFSEQNLKASIVDPSGSLIPGLPLALQTSLHNLATGRSEPVEDVVLQIAEFFIEAEDERAEGPLIDALTFYMTQYHGVRL